MADFMQVRSDLYDLWLSSFTRRWHQNAALSGEHDLVCAHQGRCGVLVIILWPDHSVDLLRAAVTHDAAESVVGDLAQPFRAVGGSVVEAHRALEAQVLRRMGFAQELSMSDSERLKLVDMLDAYLFVGLMRPSQLERSEWLETRTAILSCAWACNVGEAVKSLLDAQVSA